MERIRRREFVTIAAGAMISGAAYPQAVADSSIATPEEGKITMDIQRIGIIEASSGLPIVKVAPIISYGTVHGGLFYLAGITADPIKPGPVKEQTKQVLDRIDLLLKRAGTNKSKLLSAQVWLTDMSLFVEHNEAWNEWVDPKNPPVRACLHSPSLWMPGLLVEIMATAAL